MIKSLKKILFLLSICSLIFFAQACKADAVSGNDKVSLPEKEVYEIAIENVTLRSEYPGTEDVERRINEITVPAIGCRVKIVNCHIEDHKNLIHMASAGTKKLDVMNTGLTVSLSELVSEGAVIELNELLKESGNDIWRKEADLLRATTIDGKIYAVSSNLYPGHSSGIGYNENIARKYGIDVPSPLNLEALTDIGKLLKLAAPDIYITTQGDGTLTAFDSFYAMETFGGDLNYGVIFNPGDNTNIVNAYVSEEYRNYCITLKNWREKGYIPADSLISGADSQKMFNEGKIFFQYSSVSPATEILLKKKNLNFREVLVAMTPNRLSTSNIQEFAWGISSSCEYPPKAMELMNFIYNNPEVANLLQNGRENIDYIRNGKNTIRYMDGIDGSNVGYGSYFSLYGDSTLLDQFSTEYEISFDAIKEFSARSDPDKTFGYVFHTEAVSTEIAAVTKVTEMYRPILETGLSDDVDETLKQFQDALKDAGIDRIMDENRQQLLAWLDTQ